MALRFGNGDATPTTPRETQLHMGRTALSHSVEETGHRCTVWSGTKVNHGAFLEEAVRFEPLTFFFLGNCSSQPSSFLLIHLPASSSVFFSSPLIYFLF